MSCRWEDLDARARGLGLHLLNRAAFEELIEAPELVALRLLLERYRIADSSGPAEAAALELAIRRWAARLVGVLQRRLGDRAPRLRVLLEDEDRRSLRALVRGAAAAAPADQRLAGLIPTASLPERILRELAHQPDPRAVAVLLTSWRHPFGAPLLAVSAAAGAESDPYAIELALDRTWASRAVEGARRCRRMRQFTAAAIDLRNARAALVLAAEPQDAPLETSFLPGGRRLDRDTFLGAARADGTAAAASRLAEALGSRTLGRVISRSVSDPGGLDDAILTWRIGSLARQVRLDPLGPEPVLHFLLRLRRQVVTLRRIVWAIALGAPGSLARTREAA